jgi:hypothetical protein
MHQSMLRAAIAALTLTSAIAQAHFKLDAPASWIAQDDKGDPQKMAPCGGTMTDGGTRTGAVTEMKGGSMLPLTVTETVFHPGHYRVALARRINLLPGDPEAVLKQTDKGMISDHGVIDPNPKAPVLVDGLWPSKVRRNSPLETKVHIPNIDCESCVLQVIQFMENHPGFREGGYSYHHCAIVNIKADAALPVESGW